jgi:hypothetical protein
MAAPTPTTRVSPTGIKLKDGYQTLVTIALDTNIEFWEKAVTPPGMDGMDKIDQTTMHNIRWRTCAPRSLVTLTDAPMTVAYDPQVYTSVLAVLNVETTITERFPDGSTLAYYGFLQKFEPQELTEGAQPEATITIVPTNFDPVNKVEAAPVLTSVAGT